MSYDQSVKADAGKRRLSLVPPQIKYDIAEVREYGCKKYGDPDNWKKVELPRYIDAMLRHTEEFLRDPHGKDPESGIEHYKHAECNWAFISEMMAELKPAADVVEVVRCEKCEYGESYDDGVSFVCNKDAWATAAHGDHFCSYGKRKDGVGE